MKQNDFFPFIHGVFPSSRPNRSSSLENAYSVNYQFARIKTIKRAKQQKGRRAGRPNKSQKVNHR
jgi:hypothetical protein